MITDESEDNRSMDRSGGGEGREPERVAAKAPHRSHASVPTRQLCAAMSLDAHLRDEVLEAFLGATHRAWAPNYGIDSTAAIRHAWRARRWERALDVLLCVVLLGGVGWLLARWWIRGDLAQVGLAVALIGAGILVRRLLRWRKATARGVVKWLWRRKRVGRRLLVVLVLVLAVALGFIGHGLFRALRRDDVVIAVAAACVILLFGIVDAFVAIRWARKCLQADPSAPDAPPLREQPALMPLRMERRLSVIEDHPDPEQSSLHAEARLLAYDLPARDTFFVNNTFVGSGSSIGQFEINVDVERGRPGADGKRKKVKQVQLLPLLRGMERIARTEDLPLSWAGYRMYVNGLGLTGELLPDPAGPPVTWKSMPFMLGSLDQPTASRRTYLCIQVPVVHWDEQVILTLFVRADLTGRYLILHNDLLILPGIGHTTTGWVKILPTDLWTHLKLSTRRGIGNSWPAAIGSPGRIGRRAYRVCRRRWERGQIRLRVLHHERIQHGAAFSIREVLSEGATIVDPVAIQDIKRTIAFLMQALRESLQRYLEARNVDTSALAEDIRTEIRNQHIKIDKLNADNVTFGDRSSAGKGKDARNKDARKA